ncbi:MAG: hypothetical protein LBR07_00995 [Puniceicoccales bacterium]|jgi:lauroyl/myristoyl acyltransferase/ADP-heptose:LPS heptosyltransferase|nr:hypothetical protein [Puniceicoccales bacterium]
MTYFLLAFLGRLLAASPTAVPALLARFFGWLIFVLFRRRVRAMLANLHHAFPEMSERRRRAIGLESCRRMVEMSLFVLASPYFSRRRIRRCFTADPSLDALVDTSRPGVVLVPHFSLMEAITLIPAFYDNYPRDEKFSVGVFYRPFASASLERWVRRTRERHGLRLLSNKRGFLGAARILAGNGRVAVLFDQNAATAGALTLFFDRLASTGELAGILAERHRADTHLLLVERTGFWRGRARCEPTAGVGATAAEVTVAANRHLEKLMRSSDSQCADWLWLHRRWKVATRPATRLRLPEFKRDLLAPSLAAAGLDAVPRVERFWFRLPGNLAGALLAVPLLRAIRAARPDAHCTVFGGGADWRDLFVETGLCEEFFAPPAMPDSDAGDAFWQRRALEYPDTFFLFAENARADAEAERSGAPQRFGIQRGRRRRRALTHPWTLPAGIDESRLHLTRLWELWLQRAHGLDAATPLDCSPATLLAPETGGNGGAPVVALLRGFGEKRDRWRDEHWARLCEIAAKDNPTARFVEIFPAAKVGEAARATKPRPPARVERRFVRSIPELALELARCRCAVGADTDALHLANFLGVPIVALFGPTNPLLRGPVFEAPQSRIQPAGARDTGGARLADITPEQVAASIPRPTST